MSTKEANAAFALFTELSDISMAIFSDLRALREDHVEIDMSSPYRIRPEELDLVCDPGNFGLIRRIATAPRFAWDLSKLSNALEAGQRWALGHTHVRRLSRVNARFETSNRLVLMLVMQVRRMAIASPRFVEVAFGLDAAEVRALYQASDIALIEAAPQVRLTFRSDRFRDVLRIAPEMVNTQVKESVLDMVIGASGLRRARIV